MSGQLILDEQSDALHGYQQAKAIEVQQGLRDLRRYVDSKNQAEAAKLIDAALLRVHALVGLLLAPRIIVGQPASQPQLSMPESVLKTETF